MNPKSVFHTLSVLIACSIAALVTANCPIPMQSVSSSEASTGIITGKVLAQGQTDNSGVTVTAELTDGIRSVSIQNTLSSRQSSKAVVAAQATTNANGEYTLNGLAPGIYALSAISKDGLEKAVTRSVTVSAGSKTQALLMILTQTGQIQGVVTLFGQADSTGVVVFVAGTSYSAMTDKLGNFLMSYVPAGTNYTIVASKVGYSSWSTNVNVNVNSMTRVDTNGATLSHALQPYVAPTTTGSVSGNVTLSDVPNGPYAGIFVYLVGTSYICVTDDRGNFNLTGVAALKTYTIMASKPGYTAETYTGVDVKVGATVPPSFSFVLKPVGPYVVTYDANGANEGAGSVPIDPTNYMPGFRVTVAGNSGNLVKTGYSFTGWQVDGRGITYTQGSTFIMGTSDVTLCAQWTSLPNQPVPVASIAVTGTGGATTIPTPLGILQMIATVLPANATDPTVVWSVTDGSGHATISATGLLSAVSNGTVIVKATAHDGSGVSGTEVITLTNQTGVPVASITVTGPIPNFWTQG